MIEQLSNAITFYAHYTAAKVGQPGLTVTVDVYKGTTATPIVNDAAATELAGGLYYYTLASGSVDAVGAYIAVFTTATTTVDQRDIPAMWVVGTAGIENLDATVSSRGTGAALDATGAQAAAAAALAAYDAATAADVTGGGGATAADVWSYGSRTLTQAVVVGPGGAINGSAITLHRGDSFSASLTGLGDITGRSKLWFTVKRRTTKPDADAMIQIVETTGVVTVAGAAPASADNGALTVTNAAAGNVTITLDEVETAKLTVETGWPWDIQMRSAGGEVTTLAVGTMAVTADVTRATS